MNQPLREPPELQPNRSAVRLAMTYAVFASLWIGLSDKLLAWLANDAEQITDFSMFKGWLFVAATSLLLYTLIRRQFQKIRDASKQEQAAYTQNQQNQALLALKARRAEALLQLPTDAETLSEHNFMQRGQELIEQLTNSQIAFIHLVQEDQETIELVAWSHATLAHFCTAAYNTHYPINQAGIWAEALRQRAPVVINDYASAPDKHGLPDGHVQLTRFISVPVLEGGLVRMMMGVGNKPEHYTDTDVETARLIADTIWRIVRQRRSEKALIESEQRHRLLADNVSDVIWTTDLQGRFTYISPSVKKLSGFSVVEVMHQSLEQMVGLLNVPTTHNSNDSKLSAKTASLPFATFSREIEQPCKDGSMVWTDVSTSGLYDTQGELVGMVGVTRDISKRKEQQKQLQLAARIFAQGHEGITVTDASGTIVMVNPAFTRITGYTETEVLGQNPRLLHSGQQNEAYYQAMWDALTTIGHWSGEIWNKRKDGTTYPEWLSISALRDTENRTTHYVASFSDLSQAKAAESRIQWLSHFDPLTGLPNRALLQDRAAMALSTVQRAGEPLAMILMSIDHFSNINETYGHQTGDQLLVEVASRLSQSVRDQDTAARLGGKEFMLILPGTSATGAAHVATDLLCLLKQAFNVNGQSINVTASIGIASFPDNGTDFDSLFNAVEIAMHRAQALGRNSYQFYSTDLYEQLLARDAMTKALGRAIEHNQLRLVYQPQVDLQSGKICGMEALLRWTHPELGEISPMQFIPLAEESGLIVAIGEWVLHRSCQDIRHWIDKGMVVPHVAVNASPLQFRNNNLVAQVANALTTSMIEPGMLYIEVTESTLMDDVPRTEAMLKALKNLGIKLSLDDFGTGYSSLSYLKRFPFDQVKIDQSFVRDITTNQSDSMLVGVIVSMAHGFGMKAIAEGVETEAQCEILRTNVCDEIQGYFFSKPVSAQAMEALFIQNQQLPEHLLHPKKPQRTLLLVDDEPHILASLMRVFRRDGYHILSVHSGAEGLELLSKHKVDVIISDQRMPGMTGVEFLQQAKVNYPDTIRIVLSGYTELKSVTDAINEGSVYRFLTKPWDDDLLRAQIGKAIAYKAVLEENHQLDIQIRTSNRELVAANRQLADVLHELRQQMTHKQSSAEMVQE